MAIFEGVTGSKDKKERNMEGLQTVTKFHCSQKNVPFVPLFPKIPETQLLFPCSRLYFPFVPLFPIICEHVPLFPETPGGSLNMEYHHPLLTEHDYISRIIAFAECINGINGQP